MAKGKSTRSSNLGLKLISLLLALLLEIYFYSPDNSITAKIPAVIEVVNVPSDLMIVDPPGAERGIPATIEVRGPGPLVAQVKATPNKIPIFYPSGEPREFSGIVDIQQLQLPSGVEVVNVEPMNVEIRSEKVARKELLVVVERTGEPAAGYKVDELNVFPDTVLVRGPLSQVEGLRAVETKPVDVSDLSQSSRRAASLKTFGPLVSLDVTMVTVDIKLAPIETEANYADVPILGVAEPGLTTEVSPSTATVTIQGPAPALQRFNRKDVKLRADARGLGTGRHDVRLTAELPDGLKLVATSPGRVSVNVVRNNE